MQEPGRYTICEEIASGATATVFLAEDRVLRRKVALKKLHPHLLNHPETVKRFENEAVAVASLSHENIIQVYDFGYQDRNQYLAMEYVDGATLERLLGASAGPLPNRVCLSILRQLLSGLIAAHQAGIVHRDIKPSNLLVDRKGRIRIADFGIAFLAEEKNITKTGSYLGTPVYSAPEQARGQPASAKSDIFSSGILIYRCLTGRLPFEGETSHAILSAILDKVPAKALLRNRRLLPGLSELTERMLAKNPERRPSAAACLAELEAVAGRHSLSTEGDWLCKYQENPRTYSETEERELAEHFRALARKAEFGGSARLAVKLAAQADLHGAPIPEGPEIGPDPVGLFASPFRKRAALVMGGLAGCALLAGFLFAFGGTSRGPTPPAGASTVATPSAPDPAPPQGATAMTVLAEIPAEAPVAAVQIEAPRAAPSAPRTVGATRAPRKVDRKPSVPIPIAAAVPTSASIPAAVAGESAAVLPAGFLMVKTNPPFAKVSLDGKELGVTPFKAPCEIPPGEHEILIEREGCLPRRSQVAIASGETSTLRLILDQAESAARE